MRSFHPFAPALFVLGLTLAGCSSSSGTPYEITGPNQVIVQVSGMT